MSVLVTIGLMFNVAVDAARCRVLRGVLLKEKVLPTLRVALLALL